MALLFCCQTYGNQKLESCTQKSDLGWGEASKENWNSWHSLTQRLAKIDTRCNRCFTTFPADNFTQRERIFFLVWLLVKISRKQQMRKPGRKLLWRVIAVPVTTALNDIVSGRTAESGRGRQRSHQPRSSGRLCRFPCCCCHHCQNGQSPPPPETFLEHRWPRGLISALASSRWLLVKEQMVSWSVINSVCSHRCLERSTAVTMFLPF